MFSDKYVGLVASGLKGIDAEAKVARNWGINNENGKKNRQNNN